MVVKRKYSLSDLLSTAFLWVMSFIFLVPFYITFVNAFKVRKASLPDKSGAVRVGKVNYERKPEDPFIQFIWFALRSGVLDSISF